MVLSTKMRSQLFFAIALHIKGHSWSMKSDDSSSQRFFFFRCIDEWFKRKNCCPEHPGDDWLIEKIWSLGVAWLNFSLFHWLLSLRRCSCPTIPMRLFAPFSVIIRSCCNICMWLGPTYLLASLPVRLYCFLFVIFQISETTKRLCMKSCAIYRFKFMWMGILAVFQIFHCPIFYTWSNRDIRETGSLLGPY